MKSIWIILYMWKLSYSDPTQGLRLSLDRPLYLFLLVPERTLTAKLAWLVQEKCGTWDPTEITQNASQLYMKACDFEFINNSRCETSRFVLVLPRAQCGCTQPEKFLCCSLWISCPQPSEEDEAVLPRDLTKRADTGGTRCFMQLPAATVSFV